MIKKLVRNSFNGVAYGSFAYLLVLLFKIQTTIPTTGNIISVLVMSVGIGWVSLIFEFEQFPFLIEILLHFLGTLTLVITMMYFNSWNLSGKFWISFVLLYVIFWIIIRIRRYLQIEKVNLAIQNRRLNKKNK